MFRYRSQRTKFGAAVAMWEVVFHSIVRAVRAKDNNAFVALGKNMMQIVMFVIVFYLMFKVLGLRGAGLRGDPLLYIMSGIFMYMTHIKSVSAVVGSALLFSATVLHAPVNTLVAIVSAALSSLYTQTLSVLMILAIYHVAMNPIQIEQPFAAFAMFLLAWFTGCAVGLVLLAIKPFFPMFVGIFTTLYQRANMIASGKMFVANTLPGFMLAMFDWNPLFHCIDQARGFVFINYFPRNSSWEYPLWVGIILVMLGLMGEFFSRQHASASWNARR